jgi:hypothetical protein
MSYEKPAKLLYSSALSNGAQDEASRKRRLAENAGTPPGTPVNGLYFEDLF